LAEISTLFLARLRFSLRRIPSFVEAPRKNSSVVSRSPVPQTVERVGRYRDAGVQLFIRSIYKNDMETQELLATEVMPHFA